MAHKLKHRVRINVCDEHGNKHPVLKCGTKRIPFKLFRWFFGDFCEVLVLKPGNSIEEIEVYKLPDAAVTA